MGNSPSNEIRKEFARKEQERKLAFQEKVEQGQVKPYTEFRSKNTLFLDPTLAMAPGDRRLAFPGYETIDVPWGTAFTGKVDKYGNLEQGQFIPRGLEFDKFGNKDYSKETLRRLEEDFKDRYRLWDLDEPQLIAETTDRYGNADAGKFVPSNLSAGARAALEADFNQRYVETRPLPTLVRLPPPPPPPIGTRRPPPPPPPIGTRRPPPPPPPRRKSASRASASRASGSGSSLNRRVPPPPPSRRKSASRANASNASNASGASVRTVRTVRSRTRSK